MHNPPKRYSTLTLNPLKRHQPSTCNPPNDINRLRVIHPNETVGSGYPRTNLSSKIRRGGAYVPARTFAQRRFHTKNTHIVCEDRTTDAPLWDDAGGHTGTAPTKLHQTTQYAITSSHCTFDSPRQPHGVSLPHHIVPSIAPNHVVCHYPIGVVLSIAQGWQV